MRLQSKVLSVLVPLIVVPLLGLGRVDYVQLVEISEQRTLGHMMTLLEQVALNLESRARTLEANVELFAANALVKKYVLTSDEEERYNLMQPALLRLLDTYLRAHPEYYEIRILLPDGYEDTRATLGNVHNRTEEEADTPVFSALKAHEEGVFTAVARNPDNAELVNQRDVLEDHLQRCTDEVGPVHQISVDYVSIGVAPEVVADWNASSR